MNYADLIMTDEEVARMFHVETETLQRRMARGFPRGELDLHLAIPGTLGGRRWWYRPRLMKLIAGWKGGEADNG